MILELDREIKMSRKMVKRNREIKMHIKFDFPAYNVKICDVPRKNDDRKK